MAAPAIDRLTNTMGCPVVGAEAARDFLAERPEEVSVLFFVGDAERRPETQDVAVVLGELLRQNPDRLRAALVDPAAEEALKPVYGVMMLPSLVFLRGDRFLGVIPKIRDWSDYAGALDTYLNDRSAGSAVRH